MTNWNKTLPRLSRELATRPIKGYQLLRPAIHQALLSVFGFQSQCRFSETCSEYTIRMIKTNGIMRGSLAGVRRILRCHTHG